MDWGSSMRESKTSSTRRGPLPESPRVSRNHVELALRSRLCSWYVFGADSVPSLWTNLTSTSMSERSFVDHSSVTVRFDRKCT